MGYSLRFGQLLARRILGLPDPDAHLFSSDRLAPSASGPAFTDLYD